MHTVPSPTTPAPAMEQALEHALDRLLQVRATLREHEQRFDGVIQGLPAPARPSARNLIHYLSLRTHDLTDVQGLLARHGLSSLGRAEAHVLANLDAVIGLLWRVVGRDGAADGDGHPVPFDEADEVRRRNTDALFGPPPPGRTVRIMATMPAEAATDYTLLRDLLAGGMDCMRINCAHDGPEAWSGMIGNLRRAGAELGRPCTVLMDIPGPRLRTGPMEPGPRVVKARPVRDELGAVVRAARVWLTEADAPAPPPEPADAALPLPAPFLSTLQPCERAQFRDARGAARTLRVESREAGGVWCTLRRTAYVVPGTLLRVRGSGARARVGELPAREQRIPLALGDTLVLTRDERPGRPAATLPDGTTEPAHVPCTLPDALARIRPGEPVWFDDGRIGGVVRSVDDDGVRIRITHARPGGERLGAEKGINLPETELRLPALTAEDAEVLPFIAAHADMTGYSFARSADDVRLLRTETERLGAERLGIVLKIETPAAFRELPSMLLEVMRFPAAGVMIARGDLAVECGFERLAEVQEEILCMCEAAHVPVVWATQVLEQLTRTGLPSRAEVSDAALGERAEAVMLNKGAYMAVAVRTLHDILSRMSRHQEKKRPLLAHLAVADHFFASAGPRPRLAAG